MSNTPEVAATTSTGTDSAASRKGNNRSGRSSTPVADGQNEGGTMATITATTTTTRQQLQANSHGGGASTGGARAGDVYGGRPRSTAQVPRSMAQKPNTWGSGTASGSSSASNHDNAWSNSWSAFQNVASSVLSTEGGGGVSAREAEEEERRRRVRIAEKRRRAGLEGITGVRTSSPVAGHTTGATLSTSVRTRPSTSGFAAGDNDVRTRGKRKGGDGATDASSTVLSKSGQQQAGALITNTGSTITHRKLNKKATSPTTEHFQHTNHDRALPLPLATDRGDDTFVYVHQVKPTDTLEGVAIMFNIHPSSLRRANRLWLGDSIQAKKELLLPVDDCFVKGRPLTKEEEGADAQANESSTSSTYHKAAKAGESSAETLLDAGSARISREDRTTDISNLPNGRLVDTDASEQLDKLSRLPRIPRWEPNTDRCAGAGGAERGYTHHSDVMISGIGKVEIARIPRKRLSHFPPHRRQRVASMSSATAGLDEGGGGGEGGGIRDTNAPPSSVFSSSRVSRAYSGTSGIALVTRAGEDVPSIGQMFSQVARETLDGMESVGSLVEGFVRKVVVKVGEMTREGGDVTIELTERTAGTDRDRDRERERGGYERLPSSSSGWVAEGSAYAAVGSARDTTRGNRGARERTGNWERPTGTSGRRAGRAGTSSTSRTRLDSTKDL